MQVEQKQHLNMSGSRLLMYHFVVGGWTPGRNIGRVIKLKNVTSAL